VIPWLSLSLAASAAWGLVLFVSDRRIARVWPPRRGNWTTAIWAWTLTTAIYVGLINAASADWNSLGWNWWLRWGLGGVGLTLASFWVQGRGIVDLGLSGTSGWDIGLVTTGSYAVRRHPQYAGQIVSLIGLAILGGSPAGMLAALAGCLALLYASLVEDRALARRFGAAHADYRGRVRFF
jgi:protein-S-isoprenylcysteine O-methyltransferase Ste14